MNYAKHGNKQIKHLRASITAKTLNVLLLAAKVSYLYLARLTENVSEALFITRISSVLQVTKIYGKSLRKYLTSDMFEGCAFNHFNI
jgi:hypothetical protein